MIEEFRNTVIGIIGHEIGNRVYSSVVPVNSEFPCMLFRRVYTEPNHTKDLASTAFARIRCWVYDKDGVTNEKSPSDVARDIVDNLKAGINALQVGSTEYRVEDERDDYEEETELYFTIFDVTIYYDYS